MKLLVAVLPLNWKAADCSGQSKKKKKKGRGGGHPSVFTCAQVPVWEDFLSLLYLCK